MFYFRVPDAQEFIDESGKPQKYDWEKLHEDVCWGSPVWRSGSADAMRAFDEVEDKCLGAKAGKWIAMTDTSYEIYVAVITARDKIIGGKPARVMVRMMRPVMEAKQSPPEGYVEEQPAPSPAN